MDPAMSEEMEAVRDMVNRFMQTEVAPVMDGYERRGEFPRDLITRAGEVGLYGAVFPEAVGGTNLGYLAATVIQEEMARNDVRFAACNNQQGSTCPSCIYFGGTPEQIKKYVPDLLAGKTIGMMALTESGGGSDPAGAMKTFARRDGDVYRINGQKMFASIANETEVGVLFAKTDREAGARGITGFIVEPKKYPGWKTQPIEMLGLSNAFRTNVLYLDDFVVPVENRLGAEGAGFTIVMRALQAGRVTVAGKGLGIARALLRGCRALREGTNAARSAHRPLPDDPVGHCRDGDGDRGEPRTRLQGRVLHGPRLPVEPDGRDRQVPRVSDGQAVRRQGHADFWRIRTRERVPGVLAKVVRRPLLPRRRLGQRAEDPHRRGRARLQARGPSPREERPARDPPGRVKELRERRRA
jgi:hypothetical protein